MYFQVLKGNFENEKLQQAWAKTESYIIKISSLLKEKNIDFEVILVPSRYFVYPNKKLPYAQESQSPFATDKALEKMKVFLKNNNISFYDLTPDLRKRSTEYSKNFYYEIDEHFNEFGNRVVAELLVKHSYDSIKSKFSQ